MGNSFCQVVTTHIFSAIELKICQPIHDGPTGVSITSTLGSCDHFHQFSSDWVQISCAYVLFRTCFENDQTSLGACLFCFSFLGTGSIIRRRSSQSEEFIYLERFDLESPNFTGYDVTISSRTLLTLVKLPQMTPPTALGGISREWFKQGSRNLQARRGQSASQTCGIWRCYLFLVGCKMQLNTAQKCIKRVRLAKQSNNLAIV